MKSKIGSSFFNARIIKFPFFENDIEKILSQIEFISEKSWQTRIGEKSFSRKEITDNFGKFIRNENFRCYIFEINDTPVAFLYGTIFKNTLYLDNTGFDPEFSKISPGTILYLESIEDCFEDTEVEYLDVGFGNDQGKKRYFDIRDEVVSLFVYANRFKPILCNFEKSLVESGHLLGKYAAERLNLAGRWRKYKRSHAAG